MQQSPRSILTCLAAAFALAGCKLTSPPSSSAASLTGSLSSTLPPVSTSMNDYLSEKETSKDPAVRYDSKDWAVFNRWLGEYLKHAESFVPAGQPTFQSKFPTTGLTDRALAKRLLQNHLGQVAINVAASELKTDPNGNHGIIITRAQYQAQNLTNKIFVAAEQKVNDASGKAVLGQ